MSPDPIRTLLIEDNPGDARLLAEQIADSRGAALTLEHEQRLDRALERLRRGGFDVVLLDLSLPDAKGLETVARVHAAMPQLPVVVLTGLDDDETALAAMQAGAQDYLVKGQIEPRLLTRALRYAVERKRAEENARRLLLERSRRIQAEAAERRATFLAEAGSLLASVLDVDEMPHQVTKLAVPILADCCIVDLFDEGGTLRRVASSCAKAEQEELAKRVLHVDVEHAPEQHPMHKAVRTGQATLLPELSGEVIDAIAGGMEHAAIIRDLGARSLMSVPLAARGRTLGAITFASSQPGHAYGPEDVAFAWALADRAAIAMDNAKLFRAREEMLSVVSHDLRNPLNVITVGLASLKRGVPEDRRLVFLEKIRRAADRMNRLIEDLLDVTRLETGSLSLMREVHPIAPIVADAFELLRPLAEEKGVRLVSDVPEGAPAIFADRDRVLQILGNLIGNALKFTPQGGSVTVGAKVDDGALRFAVADTGPGVPPREQARIFDRYYQAKRSDRKGGAGLGLAIAKGLVQAHGGRIWVESEPGRGATFYVALPIARPQDEREAEPAAPG